MPEHPLDMLKRKLEDLTREPYVIDVRAGMAAEHVEKIVDRKLAERDRAQAIEERMNWQ